ncbi:MAG: tetratricopeptide repeat protein [Odoribacter sp.]
MYQYWIVLCLFISHPLWATIDTKDSLTILLSEMDSEGEKLRMLQKLVDNYDRYGMDKSIEYAVELIPLLEKQPEETKTAVSYANVAIVFLNANIYDKSLEFSLKALNIFVREGELRSIAALKNTIGGVYLQWGKSEKALIYFKEGLFETEQLAAQGDSISISMLPIFYNNIGLIYSESEDKREMAEDYFEKALQSIKRNDYPSLGQCYNNMAMHYFRQKQYVKGIDCAGESMECRRLVGDEWGMARTSYTFALLYNAVNNSSEAKRYLEEAEKLALSVKSNSLLENIYSLRVKMAENEKDYETACKSLHKQLDVRETLQKRQAIEKMTALEMEYCFNKQLSLNKLNDEQKYDRLKVSLFLAIALVVVMILLYLLILNRSRRVKAEKKVLRIDLENRNKELTTNVMQQMENAELIKDVISRLRELRLNMKIESRRDLQKMIRDLEIGLKGDVWSEFETHFNNVHLGFYKNLRDRYLDLTPTELKLCAFLRLNMSSKEISSISGITVKSVDVMRGRIRKKLNIVHTDVNLVHFLSDF